MNPPAPPTAATLHATLTEAGHRFLCRAETLHLLGAHGGLEDWSQFAASWERMPEDGYMADGGRYRKRRHATYAVSGPQGPIIRGPHRPHYQSRDYNPLNGGVERWFEPVEADVGDGATLQTILRFCQATFGALAPEVARWHVEIHQFRVEARSDMAGRPTPEGMHRDGVDYVLVLLVARRNVLSGTTSIHAPDGRDLGSFTLTRPCDASLLDDTRVFHGVTPIAPIDTAQPACRDVLVVTFRRDL